MLDLALRGEQLVEVLDQEILLGFHGTEELRRRLVGLELLGGDAEQVLDLVGVEFLAVVHQDETVLRTIESHLEGVGTDHADRGEGRRGALAVTVRGGEQEVGVHLIALEQREGFGHFRESPNDLTAAEHTCGVHLHLTGLDELSEEVESLMVLHRFPIRTDVRRENVVVGVALESELTGGIPDSIDLEGNGLLGHGPVGLGGDLPLTRGRIWIDGVPEPMPRYLVTEPVTH